MEHCIKNTDGWRLQEKVQSALSEKEAAGCKPMFFEKPTFGSTDLTNYDEIMKPAIDIFCRLAEVK